MRNSSKGKRNPDPEKSATPQEVACVKKLFDDKGWPLDSTEFNDFCTMVANLETEEQKKLILEISQRFYWITANDYYGMFEKVFQQMFAAKMVGVVRKLKIIIIPLMINDDVNETKSGQFLFYVIKSNLTMHLKHGNQRIFKVA